MPIRQVAVVGGGINGIAVARNVLARHPGVELTLFEKETALACHQTGHNSGVVHQGLYYQPGGLKATLCRRGAELVAAYCQERGLPYDRCGKLVVARDTEEVERLRSIQAKATANGVPELRWVDDRELRELEPNLRGVAALYSPHTAVVDYAAVARELARDVESAGGQIQLGAEVTSVAPRGDRVAVATATGEQEFDKAITCAGLQSDRVAATSGDAQEPRIVPFFGAYFVLEPRYREVVRHLIYPVPDPRYPFLGVHLTKRIDGEMTIGPNAFISLGREAYGLRGISPADVATYATDPAFWRFAARNLPAACRELRTVLSAGSFVRAAADYVPAVADAAVTPGGRGIRAQAMNADGSLEDDFVIRQIGNTTHVRNAPSPGATSSLAIAEHVVGLAFGEPAAA